MGAYQTATARAIIELRLSLFFCLHRTIWLSIRSIFRSILLHFFDWESSHQVRYGRDRQFYRHSRVSSGPDAEPPLLDSRFPLSAVSNRVGITGVWNGIWRNRLLSTLPLPMGVPIWIGKGGCLLFHGHRHDGKCPIPSYITTTSRRHYDHGHQIDFVGNNEMRRFLSVTHRTIC